MNIFKVNKTMDAVSDGGTGSNYINKSGIYPVTIKFASIDVSKNGAKSVNFNLDYNGNEQTIYGPYITDKQDNVLDIGMGLVRDKLGTIAGTDELNIEEEEHVVGKDKKAQTFAVITDFTDLPVKMRIQMEYSLYNGEIKERKVIKSFFRADGASAEEIIKLENGEDVEIGKRLAYETEKWADNVTYKDNLTESDIENWKKAKANGSKPAAGNAPKVNTGGAAAKLFKKP